MGLNWFAKSSSPRSAAGRVLRTLGPTWSASPIRRLVQAAFFGLFLVLFFYVAWPYGSGGYAEIRSRKELVDIELFLALDPLVSLSAAIADRAWVWSLSFAGVILAVSLLVPRVFCGYLCPMGTTIDMFDWCVSHRIRRFRISRPGGWRNLRYYVLAGVLTAAVAGVMLGGYVAAIPVVTRGLQFIASPLQTGAARGWSQVPPLHAGHFVSIALFALVLGLGLLRPRFWCRHVCPTGAIFSLVNRFRLTERKVSSDCIQCGQCSHVCSFDAINDDFTTLVANCAFCQTCGGVCPVGAIDFGGRLAAAPAARPMATPQPPAAGPCPDFSRRGFMIGLAVGAVTGGLAAAGVRNAQAGQAGLLVRPPGSVPEDLFSRLCVRCGQCLRVCPNNLLQPTGIDQGFDRLWTPWANTDWAGCDPTCNNCGQVCPTGAIQALSLEAKKKTPMGLAAVDEETCLQCEGGNDCEITGRDGNPTLICREVCALAGYEAIDIEEDLSPAPTVLPEQCVGCGLCQAKCFRENVVKRKLLGKSAIRVQADLSGKTTPRPDRASPQPGRKPPSSSNPPATIDVPHVPYVMPDD
jgi:ferredoxin